MKEENRSLIKRMISYITPYKKELLLSGLLLLISTIIGFLQPMVIRTITDEGMLEGNISILCHSVIFLSILVLLNQGIDLVQTKLFAEVHNSTIMAISHQVFYKLVHLKKQYFEDKNNAEILSFLQMDTSQVASVTDRYTVMIVTYIFRFFSGLFGLFLISWELTLVVLAMVPIKVLVVRSLSSKQEQAMNQMIEQSRDFSRWYGDNLSGVDEIKLWGLFKKRDQEFRKKQAEVLRLQKRSTMIDSYNSFGESLLEWSVTILLYLIGGLLVCWGKFSIGAVFAFVSYSGFVTGPIGALINLGMFFSRIFPSAKRLFIFLDMDEEKNGDEECSSRFNLLEFCDVSFRYEANRPILKNVNFYIRSGEKVAIIGPNGSGKSTILDLLLRFYEPENGLIMLDGKEIQTYSLESYRKLFSVVSQNPYLFLGSVMENVDLLQISSKQRVDQAIRISGVKDYISRMPEGGQTQIGQNGTRLSGGEKQKLAVARALLKDAPFVILDEATSSFDIQSDANMHDVIVHEMKDKTVLMITHHYADLEDMDRVYRLENGTLSLVSSGW